MRRLIKNRRGQVMLITVLGIVLILVAVVPLLTYVRLSTNEASPDFRNKVKQISLNFKEALIISLSEVSQALELKSRAREYQNYTSLEEYPIATSIGLGFLAEWQNETSLQYYGLGLKINISDTEFECKWGSSPFSSWVNGTIKLDILNYGLEGWKYNAIIESNLYILGLDQIDGNYTSFIFHLSGGNELPINGLQAAFIRIYYNSTDGRFLSADNDLIKLYGIGDGDYLVKFYSPNMSDPPCIKMLLQDPRGIIVGAIPQNGVVLTSEEDHIGPVATNLNYNPKPVSVNSSFTLSGTIDDTGTGWSYIDSAEYFVDDVGSNGTGSPMQATDGQFDSYSEDVETTINVVGWTIGNHTIYVHGLDAKGNWGDFSGIIVEITIDQKVMYVYSIDMSLEIDWFFFWARVRGLATVTIYDTNEAPVESANVSGTWTGTTSEIDWGLTDNSGQVTLKSDWIWIWGWEQLTFTFTVDDVVKNGWNYDSNLNNETSDTVEYP